MQSAEIALLPFGARDQRHQRPPTPEIRPESAPEQRNWRATYLPGVDAPLDAASPESPDEQRVWRPWWDAYLSALSRLGNHAAAARAADVDVTRPKRDRKRFEHFKLACHDACEEAYDLLEQTAWLRATAGERVAVEVVREEFDVNGKLVTRVATTTTKQRTSDALLIRLLQAKRPREYSDKHEHRRGGLDDAPPVPVEVDTRRTPERVRDLIEAMMEVGMDMGTQLPGFEVHRRPVDGSNDGSNNGSTGSSHAP